KVLNVSYLSLKLGETALLHRSFIVVLESATAASLSSSTSHGSFIIVVTTPSPFHPCKFKPK
ncbi:hypothetical protein S83_031612, partial [Arachis hypogaea]